MARSIQSPGVELREIDLTLRPASLEGTTVFVAGFANQGPVDEVLQPTSISEWEQIYGYPTNSAEQYFYQTAKVLFNTSPAKILATRLPYGYGKGEGFAQWRYSALVYPAKSFKAVPAATTPGVYQSLQLNITDNSVNRDSWANMKALSGLEIAIASTSTSQTSAYRLVFSINGEEPLGSTFPTPPYTTKVIALTTSGTVNDPAEAAAIINNFWTNDRDLSGQFYFNFSISNNKSLIISIDNVTKGTAFQPADFARSATPANVTTVLLAYNVGKSEEVIPFSGGTNVTSTLGFSGGNVYFFGKPTHLEISEDQYTQLITENIDWQNKPGTQYTNTPFEYDNLNTAGLIILNKAQVTVNNNFEGYYVGIIDNNNYNPATPFNGVGSLQGVQSNMPENLGTTDYVVVPTSRLNFPLSAGRVGDGTSISEIMENLNNFDLGTSDYDDTVTMGVFKLRKSIYTPDTVTLDYVLQESFVGSLDFHRQVADQTGGPAKPFFIGELAERSNNIKVMVNPWISNQYNNTWIGTNGKPSKKVRFLSNQLETPFKVPGNVDTYESFVTRVGAPSGEVRDYATQIGKTDALFPLGVYSNTIAYTKNIGQMVQKLERAFDLVENSDVYPMNLAVEAGLGTIYVNAISMTDVYGDVTNVNVGPFIDNRPMPTLSAWYKTNAFLEDNEDPQLGVIGQNLRSNYNAVANVFLNMAEKRRKDFMVILDPIRQIFVQGSNSKIINTKKLYSPNAGIDPTPYAPGFVTTNFSQHIYWPLRHQFGSINSSYAAVYANWAQVLDTQSNRQLWIPFSGVAAAAMANTDFNFNPWQAPAGFTRGVLTGINDLAVYPRQNQRDQLYKASFNPVTFFPGEGFVIFGQKTTLKKPSAFDRINVRRLFLVLETITKNTLKYFVFEPNTLFTRTQVVNTLTPIFDNARNNEGIYDYLIVCDERNNTPDVIDNNELKVDIYIKPVRTAEFILVTFYATRTGQDFQELVGG